MYLNKRWRRSESQKEDNKSRFLRKYSLEWWKINLKWHKITQLSTFIGQSLWNLAKMTTSRVGSSISLIESKLWIFYSWLILGQSGYSFSTFMPGILSTFNEIHWFITEITSGAISLYLFKGYPVQFQATVCALVHIGRIVSVKPTDHIYITFSTSMSVCPSVRLCILMSVCVCVHQLAPFPAIASQNVTNKICLVCCYDLRVYNVRISWATYIALIGKANPS